MPTFVAEKLPLQQVFSNLISNAIKHNRNLSGSVKISVTELDDFYAFSVADDGPGIAPSIPREGFCNFSDFGGARSSGKYRHWFITHP